MRYTVHFRLKRGIAEPQLSLQVCSSEEEALKFAGDLMKQDGVRVAFIQDANDVLFTEQQLHAKLKM
jgi:hypothetical protein